MDGLPSSTSEVTTIWRYTNVYIIIIIIIAIHGLALANVNLPTQFEVSISTHYEDMKGDTKCVNGVVWGS